ncbi:SDR family NAD(P)-dependent oxidoreductase [Salininema proteolyticum]|uniref:SDR family NAD(P)-dependent oxidoreductase n=1 Tax=Salininema proteolyticum TaxID=1607685 RepID=A0ABV8TY81_9ACTN
MAHTVVTGGGTGIGRAIAHAFAERGDSLTLVGRREEKLAEVAAELPGTAVDCVPADLTTPEGVGAVAGSLTDGTVDVLVNNAGGLIDDEYDPKGAEGVRRMIDLNLTSAVLLTEALWENLARPGGRVVNLSSLAAQRGNGLYGAAKAGVIGWSTGVARKGGPEGITANTIAPGYIMDTEFFEGGRAPHHDRLIEETLLKKAGEPAHIAATAVFLASEGAGLITGQTIAVNGGSYIHY